MLLLNVAFWLILLFIFNYILATEVSPSTTEDDEPMHLSTICYIVLRYLWYILTSTQCFLLLKIITLFLLPTFVLTKWLLKLQKNIQNHAGGELAWQRCARGCVLWLFYLWPQYRVTLWLIFKKDKLGVTWSQALDNYLIIGRLKPIAFLEEVKCSFLPHHFVCEVNTQQHFVFMLSNGCYIAWPQFQLMPINYNSFLRVIVVTTNLK